MVDRLSDRQQAILAFIEDYIEEHDYPPSIRDIQQGCGISSTSVVKYNLDRLTQLGLMSRQAEISRGLVLKGSRSHPQPETVAVPLMGTIAAGSPFPLPASDTWSDPGLETVDLPQAIVGAGKGLYALRVKGDSMIDALIGDGDLVLMEQANEVRNGQTAAVRITPDEETTLKKFYRENSKIRLQPANSQMDPIIVDADRVQVLSRLVAVWRYLG
jgi:repressor LexA